MGSIFDGLTLIDTYAYYDRPVLFTARNSLGWALLVELLDEGEDYEYETWLLAHLSEETLTAVKQGVIDFHDAFLSAHGGACVEWTFYTDPTKGDRIAPRLVTSLTIDDLPLPGASAAKPSPERKESTGGS